MKCLQCGREEHLSAECARNSQTHFSRGGKGEGKGKSKSDAYCTEQDPTEESEQVAGDHLPTSLAFLSTLAPPPCLLAPDHSKDVGLASDGPLASLIPTLTSYQVPRSNDPLHQEDSTSYLISFASDQTTSYMIPNG